MKEIAVLLAFLLLMSGCNIAAEEGVVYERRHYSERADISENSITERAYISTPSALSSAIRNIVNSGMGGDKHSDILMTRNYPGDVITDAENIAAGLLSTDPLFSYGVLSITPVENGSTLNITELMISVIYQTDRDITGIKRAPNTGELEKLISGMFTQYETSLIFRLNDSDSIDGERLNAIITKTWQQNGASAIGLEGVEYEMFPKEGTGQIIELNVSYLAPTETLQGMQSEISIRAEGIAEQCPAELPPREKIIWLSSYLESNVYFDITATKVAEVMKGNLPKETVNTAYGALLESSASQEGFTLAASIILDKMGISSQMIQGTYEGELYHWLVLQIDGETTHFDVTPFAVQEIIITSEGSEDEAVIPEYTYFYTVQQGEQRFSWDEEVYGEF